MEAEKSSRSQPKLTLPVAIGKVKEKFQHYKCPAYTKMASDILHHDDPEIFVGDEYKYFSDFILETTYQLGVDKD